MQTRPGTFRPLRIAAIVSLLCVIVTTALLTQSYRRELIRETVHLAQVGNLALAQATLNAIRPEIDAYLALAAHVEPQEIAMRELSARLTQLLDAMRGDAALAKVKLYNRRGLVIFSTDHDQIGQNESGNARFRLALNGQANSNLKYHDLFDLVDGAAKDTNLIGTYVPVRVATTGSIEAVFEIYTDATPFVAANERALFTILAGAAMILLLLGAVIVMLVWQANKAMESRQHPTS